MKKLLSSRGLFLLGFLLLVATNIIVLSGVALNQSGQPESLVTLTERELSLPYRVHKENSGLSLRLNWRTLDRIEDSSGYSNSRTPVWLNADKLAELGFDINALISADGHSTHFKQPLPREVFIVLEYDGTAYREALARAESAFHEREGSLKLNSDDKSIRENYESAEKRLNRERLEEPRLFAIDAGLDPGRLRDKYSDCGRFIIAKGLIQPGYGYAKDKEDVSGYLSKLSVASLHVPLNQRRIFDAMLARDRSRQDDIRPPRYAVKLAYGSRFEPWIMSVSSLDEKSD
ncbi:MAG: DUF4824 family protein [Desulfuromonadales bacterium]|nr:DUF4824 family protein [Desulfuromonadales bacterium]